MDDNGRNLTAQIRVALSLLAGLASAAAIGISVIASLETDRAAVAKQRSLVQHAFNDQIKVVAKNQETITIWDDHVINARAGNREWLNSNVGEWMFEYFGHDRAYVISDRDELVYAMRGGETVEPRSLSDEVPELDEIASEMRQRLIARRSAGGQAEPLASIAETRVIKLDGRPAILSVRPIIPYTQKVNVPAGAEYLYASLNLVDGSLAAEIGEHILVSNMRFDVEPPADYRLAGVPLVSSAGEVLGYLVWEADRPGLDMLKQILPAGILALIIVGGIAVYIGRKLRTTSEDLHASERQARHLASHDVLTRLPNRGYFEERLDQTLERVRTGHGETALLFLDLDRFKNVNDTLGHRAGDELVRQTAVRLSSTVGNAGTVARIGGDEFGVVISAPKDSQRVAIDLSEKLLRALSQPFHIEDELVYVGVSIGIATAPETGSERQELLRKADIALYDAKKQGRGCYSVFSDSMGDILKQRRRVEADLRSALASGTELQLFYQPLYTHEHEVLGAEALLRWNHPVHRSMSPLFIISVAEEAGLIMQLGDWILKQACKTVLKTDLPLMSVNVSAVQLRDEQFAERCLSIIRAANVDPKRIQVEVTETVLIDNPDLAIKTFTKLRAAGVGVAIDDFGTGYSSMSYLQNYPVDRLKIDRSFVQGLAESDQGRAIVSAMLEMARALGLQVIAEGVETVDQCNVLHSLGCDEMQGYLFSRPLSEAHFLQGLARSVPMSA